MSCWALVPVKPREAAKRRLAGRLSPRLRLELTRAMLAGVIEALQDSRGVDHVGVVSAERDTVPSGVAVLPDRGSGLNAALEDARLALRAVAASEFIVLPADLPLITAADVDGLVQAGRESGFAIATDRAGRGTNALYLRAESPAGFRFGADSRAAHVAEAIRTGCAPAALDTPGLRFDVDEPEDLDRLIEAAHPRYTFLTVGSGGTAWPMQRATRPA